MGYKWLLTKPIENKSTIDDPRLLFILFVYAVYCMMETKFRDQTHAYLLIIYNCLKIYLTVCHYSSTCIHLEQTIGLYSWKRNPIKNNKPKLQSNVMQVSYLPPVENENEKWRPWRRYNAITKGLGSNLIQIFPLEAKRYVWVISLTYSRGGNLPHIQSFSFEITTRFR